MLPSLSGNESMSNVDAAWMQMEESTNLMMVSGVLTFDEVVAYDDLMLIIRHRLLKNYPRFKQRVSRSSFPLVASAWENDPNFDLRTHVSRIALPSPADEAALKELSSEVASTPLEEAEQADSGIALEGGSLGLDKRGGVRKTKDASRETRRQVPLASELPWTNC